MSLNKVTFVGRVGRDPQIHDLNGGKKVVSFSILTKEFFIDANGQQQEIADWHRLSVYIPTWVQYTMRYIKSGDKVMVTSEVTTSIRTGANGKKFTKYGFNVQEVTLLEKNPNQQRQNQSNDGQHNSKPQYNNRPQQAQTPSNNQPNQSYSQGRSQPLSRSQQGSNQGRSQPPSRPSGFPTKNALDKDGYPKLLDPNCI